MVPPGSLFPHDRRRSPLEIEHLALRLDALLSTLAAGVVEVDLNGRHTYANPYALRTFGVAREQFIGQTLTELGFERYDESGVAIGPESAPVLRAAREGHPASVTIHYIRQPSVDVWLESHIAPLSSPAGERIGSVVSFIDVTDRFRLEAARRAGAERMNDVLRLMAAGVMLVNTEGRIEYANAAATAGSGLKPEDVIGQLAADPVWQLTDAAGNVMRYDDLPIPTALRERRAVLGVELGVPTFAGTTTWIRVSVFPLLQEDGALCGAVVTTVDITEHRALTEQLLHAQKIEGIGQLAGGIAHDFNNLLTAILGNAELALHTVAPASTTAADLTEIRDAARRGEALTRQLLTFARKQVVQPRVVYLDRLTLSLEKLLHRVLGEEIDLVHASADDLWPVTVDPGQMEQVIVNMAINARHAMPRGGALMLETRNHVVDAREAQANPGADVGEFVVLSIGDTGAGMSREVLAHIFEPFFTTKPLGSGSGLGLSICHGVIKQARGFIAVESVPERGTTFRIHLPRTTDAVTDAAAPPLTPLAKGAGTILLVEDEEAVRSLVARALAAYGYEVLAASSAAHALELHNHMTTPLDLLLTDVVMPDMRGPDLVRALHARVPALPVLFMTGYVDLSALDMGEVDAEENLLLKPFTPMELVRRVQRKLAR